ncbi:MAG: helix-turn-helix transcriptional regulator [Actinobacteria bacterium]|nr:helix-turn-helix transcriptional regulator [Actinomycetota bacterium]MCG2803252.1 helix-turn-helix transcriptional regulator [Cellulomonas sp.]
MRNLVADKRREAGLSQEDLAVRAGVSRQTINSIERGRYEPRLSLAFRLAAVFSCQIEDLFDPREDSSVRLLP